MDIRTLSLILAEPDRDGPALAAAVDLAGRCGAHVDAVALGVDVTVTDPVVAGGMAIVHDSGRAEAQERAESVARWAESRMPAGFTSYSVEPTVAPQAGIDAVISRLSRYADLIVASRPYGSGAAPLHATILESALFHGGVPILMVPESGLPDDFIGGPVVAAWDEGDEAMAAIRGALPLLKAASVVHVAMIDPPSHSAERSDPGGQLCLMLSRHGVQAEVSILARTLPTIAETLHRFALDRQAAALLIGGYGHSRLRERMFGGVTRDLLEGCKLPLILGR